MPSQGKRAEEANAALKGVAFRATTAFNRLRDDVERLGTAADTPELRRRVADSGQRLRSLAQEFKELMGRHPDRDATATQKALRDFQVWRRQGCTGWSCAR
jgi:hypothetical protein